MKKQKIIIDTDVGTDCDDLFALVYALKNPNADLRAIQTVQGDTNLRAKIARKLEKMVHGIDNTKIIPGLSCNKRAARKWWTGIEKLHLDEEDLQEEIKEKDLTTNPEYTRDTNLACIGPLTNIAYQLRKNPSIRNVQKIYVMGSHPGSHNFIVDSPAAEKVFAQSWKVSYVTKQTSQQLSLSREELESLKGNPLGDFLHSAATRWLDLTHRDCAAMYDVLTVSAALGEDYVKFRQEDGKRVSYDVDPKLKQKLLDAIRK